MVGHRVVERRWEYAPPPRIMYEALVGEWRQWFTLLPGENAPTVTATNPPGVVVFQPWVDPIISAVEVRIAPSTDTGSTLTVLAYSDEQDLSDELRRRVRHRLGALFGAALRQWVDEPHW